MGICFFFFIVWGRSSACASISGRKPGGMKTRRGMETAELPPAHGGWCGAVIEISGRRLAGSTRCRPPARPERTCMHAVCVRLSGFGSDGASQISSCTPLAGCSAPAALQTTAKPDPGQASDVCRRCVLCCRLVCTRVTVHL